MNYGNKLFSKSFEELQKNAFKRFQNKMDDLSSISYDIKDLNILLSQINDLADDLNPLKKLIYAYNLKSDIYEKGIIRKDFFNSRLITLADNNMSKLFLLNIYPLRGVDSPKFSNTYRFLECFYYINTEKPLNVSDMQNIYYGGLGERVILLLDRFDEVETLPQPDDEFFKAFGKVKWQDQSKNLFDKIRSLLYELESAISYLTLFRTDIKFFIRFLCYCSAVNNERTKIIEYDIVKAYKTYFKLMKTDLTIYEPKEELLAWKSEVGHLICEDCGGYYRLKAEESPDDFECCECGGKLKYYGFDEVTLKKAMKEGWNTGKKR